MEHPESRDVAMIDWPSAKGGCHVRSLLPPAVSRRDDGRGDDRRHRLGPWYQCQPGTSADASRAILFALLRATVPVPAALPALLSLRLSGLPWLVPAPLVWRGVRVRWRFPRGERRFTLTPFRRAAP